MKISTLAGSSDSHSPSRFIRLRSSNAPHVFRLDKFFLADADGPTLIFSLMALSNKIGLKRANITHVITVLRMEADERQFDSFEHLHIHVDDVADENLLEHFPSTNAFIQSGLDGGGGVLVHWSVA